MKYLSFTLIIIVISQFCFAQNNQKADSLKSALTNTTSDTLRVLIYEKLIDAEPDRKKSIEFGLQGFNLAKSIHYDKGIILCGNQVAFIMINNDFYKAIPILMVTKQVAERTNDKIGLVTAIGSLGYAYGKFDQEKSLHYYFTCKKLMEKEGISEDIFPISLMIGFRYKDKIKKLDSALYYLNKSYQLALNSKAYSYLPDSHLRHFGEVYYKKGQLDLAMNYFRQAIASVDRNGWNFRYIAYIFRDRNQLDSAKFYAERFFEITQKDNSPLDIILSATLLFELFQHENPAKALQYHLIATSAKDSVFNQDKARQIDQLVFEEKEREAIAQRNMEAAQIAFQNRLRTNAILGITFTLLVIAIFLFINSRRKQKAKRKIEIAYDQLKATQSQLIQSEKMASLGELTAGIAHEIQNPLNFVNNFSEVNAELIEEAEQEIRNGNTSEVEIILKDIKDNEQKIVHHGKRADAIVKGMLQHSRSSSSVKEPTDINALADEYLRLAYHGLRAKDKAFNASLNTDYDQTIGIINIVPQDIGRVVLNLINNAFYAVTLRHSQR